jgi:hypothetical protein
VLGLGGGIGSKRLMVVPSSDDPLRAYAEETVVRLRVDVPDDSHEAEIVRFERFVFG